MKRVLVLALMLAGCQKNKDEGVVADPSPLLDVAESESWEIPGLMGEAYVLRTELNVPHVYAESIGDLGRVQGFTIARDRYFEMELLRRFSSGTLTEILGDVALETDQEARGNGMWQVANHIRDGVGENPENRAWAEGIAAGINAYIDEVAAQKLPGPTELELAAPLLGATNSAELMERWDWEDVAFCTASFIYISSFETGDVGDTAAKNALPTLWDGAALEAYRKEVS